MPITLDQLFVASSRQMLNSTLAALDKARIHAKEIGLTEAELMTSRLAHDMWPLPNQIQSMWVHSAYVIDQVKTGEFRPNIRDIPSSWNEMSEMLKSARSKLDQLRHGELERIAENSVVFIVGEKPMFKFTVQNFLLSFSMPNVYFHATTAYDILRMKGICLGKFNYLGKLPAEPLASIQQ